MVTLLGGVSVMRVAENFKVSITVGKKSRDIWNMSVLVVTSCFIEKNPSKYTVRLFVFYFSKTFKLYVGQSSSNEIL